VVHAFVGFPTPPDSHGCLGSSGRGIVVWDDCLSVNADCEFFVDGGEEVVDKSAVVGELMRVFALVLQR
jgi:hypothetical protein